MTPNLKNATIYVIHVFPIAFKRLVAIIFVITKNWVTREIKIHMSTYLLIDNQHLMPLKTETKHTTEMVDLFSCHCHFVYLNLSFGIPHLMSKQKGQVKP